MVDMHDDMGPDFNNNNNSGDIETTTTPSPTTTTTPPRLPPLPLSRVEPTPTMTPTTYANLDSTEQTNQQLVNAHTGSQEASSPTMSPTVTVTRFSTSDNASLERRMQPSTTNSDAPNCSQEAKSDSTNSTNSTVTRPSAIDTVVSTNQPTCPFSTELVQAEFEDFVRKGGFDNDDEHTTDDEAMDGSTQRPTAADLLPATPRFTNMR